MSGVEGWSITEGEAAFHWTGYQRHGRKGGYSMVLKCFSSPDETTTLTFYPCNADTGPEGWYDTCADTLTVFWTDYMKLLLPYLQHVHPGFDACRDNRMDREQWSNLIQEMERDMGNIRFDDTAFDFYIGFAGWITKALSEHEAIVVGKCR